jgi:hypothetical protein
LLAIVLEKRTQRMLWGIFYVRDRVERTV